jgi:hypothetical protein
MLREMIDNRWTFNHDTYTHMTSYLLIALTGTVELGVYFVHRFSSEDVPLFFVSLAYALFCGGVGTLFAFHLDGRNVFDTRLHTILYGWALVMAAVHVAECFNLRSITLVLLRIFTYVVFGLWLITIGVIMEQWQWNDMSAMFATVLFVAL